MPQTSSATRSVLGTGTSLITTATAVTHNHAGIYISWQVFLKFLHYAFSRMPLLIPSIDLNGISTTCFFIFIIITLQKPN